MDPSPVPSVEVVETAGGRTYLLPPRNLGPWRILAPILLAAAVISFVLLALLYLNRATKDEWWAWVIIVALCACWGIASYGCVSYAAAIWVGRTEIKAAPDGTVRARDRAGWFRIWWGTCAPGTVRKFVLKPLGPTTPPGRKPVHISLWLLSAETDHGQKVWLAPAHSRAVLTELAELLAKQLAVTVPDAEPTSSTLHSPSEAPAPIPVVVEEPKSPSRDVLKQPAGSRAVLERHPDGVTITVPALGLLGATGQVFVVGLIFIAVGTVALVSGLGQVRPANAPWSVPGIALSAVISFLGLWNVVISLRTALKKVGLAVVGDTLFTCETGPLGSRRREFTRADVLDIACGPSNVSMNKQGPLPQLQIVARDETKVGLLTGHEELELKWIATILRQALGIPGEPPADRPLPAPKTPGAP
jgi:hypothetical protein